jgi:hypothetical protein
MSLVQQPMSLVHKFQSYCILKSFKAKVQYIVVREFKIMCSFLVIFWTILVASSKSSNSPTKILIQNLFISFYDTTLMVKVA